MARRKLTPGLTRFGGYVTWWSREGTETEKRHVKEIQCVGPSNLQDDDCGPGTREVLRLLMEAFRKRFPKAKNPEIRESWRV